MDGIFVLAPNPLSTLGANFLVGLGKGLVVGDSLILSSGCIVSGMVVGSGVGYWGIWVSRILSSRDGLIELDPCP